MNITIKLLAVLAAYIIFAVLSPANAEAQLVGGYASASIKDKEVVKAAKFAVKHTDTLDADKYSYKNVLSAEQQVVAGMNYKMCVRFKKNGVYTTAETVVYRDLKGVLSVTSWQIKECGQKEKD